MSLNFPDNLQLFFQFIITALNFKLVPVNKMNKYIFGIDYSEDDTEAYSDRFDELGYNSFDFITNVGLDYYYFYMYLAGIGLLILIQIFRPCILSRKYGMRFYQFLKNELIFSFLLRLLFVSYLPLGFSSFIQLSRPSSAHLCSLVSTYIILALLLAYPVIILILILKKNKDQDFFKAYGSLCEEIRFEHKLALLFNLLFLLRRVVFILTVTLLVDYPVLQLQVFMLMSLLMLIYLVHVKPFTEQSCNRLECFNELTILAVGTCLPMFTDIDRPSGVSTVYGWLVLGIIVLNFLVNSLTITVAAVVLLYRKCCKAMAGKITIKMVKLVRMQVNIFNNAKEDTRSKRKNNGRIRRKMVSIVQKSVGDSEVQYTEENNPHLVNDEVSYNDVGVVDPSTNKHVADIGWDEYEP